MINSQTKLCGIIGNPVSHSLSPLLHSVAYQKLRLNFVYLAFKVTDLEAAIKGLKALGVRGVSVTIPHKVAVMKYLDKIDHSAEKIGAVNTIVNNRGILTGFNTDIAGAIKALKEVVKPCGKQVVLIGAGGAARAIAVGLKQEQANIFLINRNLEKAKNLARLIFLPLTNCFNLTNLEIIRSAEIIINATSVGMEPDKNKSLIPKELLNPKQIVFDIVYNPQRTLLLKRAEKVGCQIIYGYKMLLYQAVGQFKLFTGVSPPVSFMEKELIKSLGRN